MNETINAIVILVAFTFILSSLAYRQGREWLQQNWHKDEVKCNPSYTIMAGQVVDENGVPQSVSDTFQECIKKEGAKSFSLDNIKTELENVSKGTSNAFGALGGLASGIADNNSGFMGAFKDIKDQGDNVVHYFKTVLDSLKNIFGQLGATFTAVTYAGISMGGSMVDGAEGIINQIPFCLKGNTLIKLQNGDIKYLKDMKAGDVIEDGTIFEELIEAKGTSDNPFFKIYSQKLQKHIYATGNHTIKDPKTGTYIEVRAYDKAQPTPHYDDVVYCFITNTNILKVGEYTFGDCKKQQRDLEDMVSTCFRGDTPVKMNNGTHLAINDIEHGMILANGRKVIATLRIKGEQDTPFYKIYSKELERDIYVTGTHLIFDKKEDGFLPVAKSSVAKEKTEEWDYTMYCLVTENHHIQVGEHVFWDWED